MPDADDRFVHFDKALDRADEIRKERKGEGVAPKTAGASAVRTTLAKAAVERELERRYKRWREKLQAEICDATHPQADAQQLESLVDFLAVAVMDCAEGFLASRTDPHTPESDLSTWAAWQNARHDRGYTL